MLSPEDDAHPPLPSTVSTRYLPAKSSPSQSASIITPPWRRLTLQWIAFGTSESGGRESRSTMMLSWIQVPLSRCFAKAQASGDAGSCAA